MPIKAGIPLFGNQRRRYLLDVWRLRQYRETSTLSAPAYREHRRARARDSGISGWPAVIDAMSKSSRVKCQYCRHAYGIVNHHVREAIGVVMAPDLALASKIFRRHGIDM